MFPSCCISIQPLIWDQSIMMHVESPALLAALQRKPFSHRCCVGGACLTPTPSQTS